MGKECPDFMCHSNICSMITYRMYNHSSLLHEFSWHHSLTQSSAARESWGKACSKLVLRLRQQMSGSMPSSKSLMRACRRVLLARPGSAGHSWADSLEHCPMCCDWHEPPLRRSSSSQALVATSPCSVPGNSPREGTGVNGKLNLRDCSTTLQPSSHSIVPAWAHLPTRHMVFHALEQWHSHGSLEFVWRASAWRFPLLFPSGARYHKLSDGPVMVETWTHPEKMRGKNWKTLPVWLEKRKGSKSILHYLVYADLLCNASKKKKLSGVWNQTFISLKEGV